MSILLGRHINVSHGFLTAPAYAKSLGCNFFQIFLGNPQQIISKMRDMDILKEFGNELKKNKMKMVVHGSYTINLCHPETNSIFQSSVKSLVQDLNSSVLIGKNCIGVIVHMGKNIKANNLSNEDAIENYIDGLKMALDESNGGTIILETGASQGTEVGSKLETLAEIYDGLTDSEKKRVMFCIDTCHIWASGYDISTPQKVNSFFKKFDNLIGIEKIACIHLNDSRTGLDSHVDRHADIGYGFIGIDGLKSVVKFAHKHHIAILMETPLCAVDENTGQEINTQSEIKRIKSWLSSNT